MNKYPQARKPHVLGPCLIAMYNTRIRDGIPENPCGKSHRLRQLISMMLDAQCNTTTLYTTSKYTMVYKANSADSSLAQHKQERVCNVLLLIGHGRKEARQRIGTGFAYRLNGQLRLHGRLQGADTLGEAFKASQCCH